MKILITRRGRLHRIRLSCVRRVWPQDMNVINSIALTYCRLLDNVAFSVRTATATRFEAGRHPRCRRAARCPLYPPQARCVNAPAAESHVAARFDGRAPL